MLGSQDALSFPKTHLAGFLIAVAVGISSQSVSAKPFKHEFGEWRSYHGAWLAVCPEKIDQSKAQFGYYYTHCWAVAQGELKNGADYPVYSFRIHRGRENGTLEFSFTHAPTDGEQLDKTRPLMVQIDEGETQSYTFKSHLEKRHNVANQYFIKESEAALTLIKAMRRGANMKVDVPVVRDEAKMIEEINIWLKGVRASERFMKAFAKPR